MKTIRLNKNYSSETGKISRFSKENKCERFENKDFSFNDWFIGFTEGYGCFNIYTNIKNKKISFTFKISQKLNNAQVLYFIKKQLKCGSVRLNYKYNMVHFLIRDSKALSTILLPIFNENIMYSSKEFSFLLFKKSFSIWLDENLNQIEKIEKINKIKNEILPLNYVASIWNNTNIKISKGWVIGFIEAEGSFYLTYKDEHRLVHGFGITQKLDKIILDEIRVMLCINSKVKYNKKGFFSLDSSDKISLRFIKKYFFKTMISIKSLEYRIWARSFRHKGKHKQLLKIKQLLNNIRIKV